MKTALHINRYINKFLTESADVTALVSVKNIRPLVLAEDTTDVIIICVSDDYSQTVDMAQAVRELLENSAYKDSDIYISQIRFSGATEDQIENVFVQRLTFSVKVTAF